jgi:hypothetical protein
MPHDSQIPLQNFIDISLDIVCIIAVDGRFTNVSQASIKNWGL